MKKSQPTTSKIGKRDPDRYPLEKFGKRLANRVNRKTVRSLLKPWKLAEEI
jgi:hypothetical protein